jgi:hypothetical protein
VSGTTGQQCLIRDGYRCFRCGIAITAGVPFECHHRLFGGPDGPENRITLCGRGNNLSDADGRELCHGRVHHGKKAAMADDAGWAISDHDRRPPQQVPVRNYNGAMYYLTPDWRAILADGVVAWTADGRYPLTEMDAWIMEAADGRAG